MHRVTVRLSEAERAAVEANAAAARMATSAYLAEAGLVPLVPAPPGQGGGGETGPLLVELMGVHRQVQGAAANLKPSGDTAALDR
ncbi:plasmid mobilization protein [Micromonospora carbonacea]|uniref:Uncharacterized protein n=1 Tax=Micromonospora carbonacea TaxID=47853 RepID=A0A1C4WW79_9ACTN|nr:hypothetical protein [Micromonospora carbonacea]SCF00423.1 hypothetical protein GA0070563_10471 [Micromonospora carbonacea]